MATPQSTLQTLLKQRGHSITNQRLAVFNALLGQEPMSMHELLEKCSKKVDKVSVYRAIAIFENVGATQRLNIGWKYKIELTDKFAEHHHHLTCLQCKKIIPINEHDLERFIEHVAEQYHFRAQGHQVEVQGYCRQCQASGEFTTRAKRADD